MLPTAKLAMLWVDVTSAALALDPVVFPACESHALILTTWILMTNVSVQLAPTNLKIVASHALIRDAPIAPSIFARLVR